MSKTAYSSEKSRIKMVILTKPGEQNHTWYNFARLNSRSTQHIIDGMKKRFAESALAAKAQVLQFYDNTTGLLIEQHNA